IAPKVGIELLLASPGGINGDTHARGPHVREGVRLEVAGEALLFPAHAGVQRDVLADRPGVVDIARVVLSFALGKAAIKPATRLLKDNLLVRLRAVCLRNEVVRAESAGGACLSSDVTQQIQVESNVASVARSKIQIALPAWSSAGGIGRRKYK